MRDVLIVGAGLCGLVAARQCQAAGLSVTVLEAALRPGGRVHSVYQDQDQGQSPDDAVADLGPTWVWPEYQAAVTHWLDELKVDAVPQFDDGLAVVERQAGSPPEQHRLPGQHGITRLRGGPQSLVNQLYGALAPGTVLLGHKVTQVVHESDQVRVAVSNMSAGHETNQRSPSDTADDRSTLTASQLLICTPLRIASETIEFDPPMPDSLMQILSQAPTWMAAQAKVVALFPNAFWRDQGLSGRVASQVGPLVEMHDHSGPDGTPAALFGFVGVPADVRAANVALLDRAIREQLIRCFGDAAASPTAVYLEDWATNALICSAADLAGPAQHPGILPNAVRQTHYNERLRFAVAETALTSPGLIDGALEAGVNAAAEIVHSVEN